MIQDKDLLVLLEQDPEQGMADLIQEYSGLLWTVCRQYLTHTEDIKECVNETFSEFYLHRQRFDPEKGTLKGYLAAIGRRCAIHRYQENRRWENAPQQGEVLPEDPFARLEQQDALERALASLDPEDQEILRMKYYQGMTAREIAASLGLPYETVKKRHQRSVKKLLKALALGLAIAVLLAVLAACTYLALRYFGFVPGYGINTNQEFPVYVLEEGVAVEGKECQIHLEDAYWGDGTLLCDLKLYGNSETAGEPLDVQLGGMTETEQPAISTWGGGADARFYRLIWEGQLTEHAGDQVELALTVEGTQVPFVLKASEESSLEEAGFFDLTQEEGGLLAVPRIEKGELVVSIHPLNQGEFATYPFLNEGVWAGYGGPDQPITVTTEDGTVLKGEPGVYSPFSGDSYVDWYFGPAQPGEYTLNVPYVYQYAAEEMQPVAVEVPLGQDSRGLTLDLPGGKLTLGQAFSIDDVTAYCPTRPEGYGQPEYRWWAVEATWEGADSLRSPAVVSALPDTSDPNDYSLVEGISYPNTEVNLWIETVMDDQQKPYSQFRGFVVGTLDDRDRVKLSIHSASVFYRWDHAFTIPMTVQPEPEREDFSAASGNYTLTVTPRRVNGQVTLSLEPAAVKEGETPSGNLLQDPYSGQEEVITLTAADGTVYQGQFQPGRSQEYSGWAFGDLPAGEYTLTVPSLAVTVEGEYPATVSLPQKAGESFSLEPVQVGYGAVALDTITGLGPDETFPLNSANQAITTADGATSAPQEPPLAASIALTLESSGEDYTLLNFGLKLSVTEEAYFLGACERQYQFSETGSQLTGLLLRYGPGLSTTDLTFVNPVYRWNHPFQVSVTIPE